MSSKLPSTEKTPTFSLTPAQDRAMDVLISRATHIALGGGSRSGKTFLFVRAILIRALKSRGSRHVIFRFRHNAVITYIVRDTLPKVLSLCFPQLPTLSSMMNRAEGFMTLPNESEIWFGGLDDKERVEKILGGEYATIYYNEASQIPWASVVMSLTRLAQKTKNLQLKSYADFNPPSKKHWTYLRYVEKRNPETKKPELDPFDFAYYNINPIDNAQNLDAGYLRMMDALPEKARKRFVLGQFSDDSEGALWTEETLAQNRNLGRQGELPDWLRVVVAVDPSGCSGPEDTRSDEVGITVVALGTDGHGYLLEDLSGRYAPEEWGRIAVDAYRRHAADRIVGEVNYGGDMVRAIVHAVDDSVPYVEVRASRGKVVRAEPVSALYDQAKIHHVGYFPELEEQLCSMTTSGYTGIRSPDRADSAIWGFTDLFPDITRKSTTLWTPPAVKVATRSARRFDR